MAANAGREPDSDAEGKPEGNAIKQRQNAQNETGDLDEQLRRRRLEQTLADQLSLPATVNQVRITGAEHTRRGFLDPILRPIVRDGPDATLGELLDNINTAVGKLQRLDIFQGAPQVYLQRADAVDPSAAATDLNVDLVAHEASRVRFNAGTSVGNEEASADGTLLWRNLFGGAERLEVRASRGTRTRSEFRGSLSQPLFSNPDASIGIEALTSVTNRPWASHEEAVRGGTLRLGWVAGVPDQGLGSITALDSRDAHGLELSGMWRQITGLRSTASPTVREDAGDSVKQALRYTYTRDRRDNPHLHQSGYLVRTALELAGVGPLGGDVAFSKSEAELAAAVPLSGLRGASIGAGLRVGALYPLAPGFSSPARAQPSRVNDRFVLGGPTDVRGFLLGGLGPHDHADAVGGDVLAAGSVNLLLPLPSRAPDSALRLHFFANAGRLVGMRHKGKHAAHGREGGKEKGLAPRDVWRGMKAAVREVGNGMPSTAVGLGLVYAHPAARFEVNFSLPLVLRKDEVAVKGATVGVGVNFL